MSDDHCWKCGVPRWRAVLWAQRGLVYVYYSCTEHLEDVAPSRSPDPVAEEAISEAKRFDGLGATQALDRRTT